MIENPLLMRGRWLRWLRWLGSNEHAIEIGVVGGGVIRVEFIGLALGRISVC